jgi:hypothetical protein
VATKVNPKRTLAQSQMLALIQMEKRRRRLSLREMLAGKRSAALAMTVFVTWSLNVAIEKSLTIGGIV